MLTGVQGAELLKSRKENPFFYIIFLFIIYFYLFFISKACVEMWNSVLDTESGIIYYVTYGVGFSLGYINLNVRINYTIIYTRFLIIMLEKYLRFNFFAANLFLFLCSNRLYQVIMIISIFCKTVLLINGVETSIIYQALQGSQEQIYQHFHLMEILLSMQLLLVTLMISG